MAEPIKTQPTGTVQVEGAFRRVLIPVLQDIVERLKRVEEKIDATNKAKAK